MDVSTGSVALQRRRLGRTDLDITRVGLGAWAMGGSGWAKAWSGQDDVESLALLRTAVERGVNWVDTAAMYGVGRSEELVGRALADMPVDDRPYVFTKCGLQWDAGRGTFGRSLAPDVVRAECEASLRRLGVERIDLYQVHSSVDESGTPIEATWEAMCALVEEGKVRWVGVSNFTPGEMARCEAVGPVASAQPELSALRRSAAADVLPWCAAHDVGVLAYSPMASGLLTGSASLERYASLPADDWRIGVTDFAEPALSRNLAVRDALAAIAVRRGTTTEAVAVAWVLSWSAVTGAIVGGRRPDHLDAWLASPVPVLQADELDAIAGAIAGSGAGAGPVRP